MFSLILPTYNEAENLPELLPKLREVLRDLPHEIIIVDDDSPDRTWETALRLAQDDPSVHVIRRMGRRGLASAVIEGFLASKGDILAVMDSDGQHDLSILPVLASAIQSGASVAIGSRYVHGGGVGEWDERRFFLSRMATRLAHMLCRTKAHDPMSGFFALKRSTFEQALPSLNPKGFKILLDLLVHAPEGTTVAEVPFTFRSRLHGASKMSARVQIEFIEYLYDVTLGRTVPLLFIKYCIVGALGVLVNVIAYALILRFLGDDLLIDGFSIPVLAGIESAIVFNFLLNNSWTFGYARLRGVHALSGFLTFNGACLFGALANYAVYALLFTVGWTQAMSVIIGGFVGAVWNYTMSRMLTWKI